MDYTFPHPYRKKILIFLSIFFLFSICGIIAFFLFREQKISIEKELSPSQGVFSSFTDLFSGKAWIDISRTTLYHDYNLTTLSFTPKYKWSEISNQIINDTELDEQSATFFENKKCIEGKCLEEKNGVLIFNGNIFPFPSGFQNKNIKNISIGTLDKIWVVGIVTQDEELYAGWVFLFDGEKYSLIQGEKNKNMFFSKYAGTIGFGGNEDEWMVVYGAYEGEAYYMRGEKIYKNISSFFGIRGMNGGFYPAIIRAQAESFTGWYVYSLTYEKPIFLKLIEDKEGNIVSAVDFTLFLLNGKYLSASFMLNHIDGNTLFFKAWVKPFSGDMKLFEFIDEGFIVPKSSTVISLDIKSGEGEVESATIIEVKPREWESIMKFYLSHDGEIWEEAEIGKTHIFSNKKSLFYFSELEKTRLFWRVELKPRKDADVIPPFLDQIRIDYRVKT